MGAAWLRICCGMRPTGCIVPCGLLAGQRAVSGKLPAKWAVGDTPRIPPKPPPSPILFTVLPHGAYLACNMSHVSAAFPAAHYLALFPVLVLTAVAAREEEAERRVADAQRQVDLALDAARDADDRAQVAEAAKIEMTLAMARHDGDERRGRNVRELHSSLRCAETLKPEPYACSPEPKPQTWS